MSLILGRLPLLGDCDRNRFEYKESGLCYFVMLYKHLILIVKTRDKVALFKKYIVEN